MQNELDPFSLWKNWLNSFLEPIGLGGFTPYIAVIPFLILIYILYLIIVRGTRLSFRKVGAPREATSGIIFVIRIVFFTVAITTILAASELVQGEAALTASALAGTALGLAFSKALSNLVSGIYVLAARPFRVGDYVKIGENEGLVLEITLNYTRLLQPDHTRKFVPNSKVVDNEVINYRVRIDDYVAERGVEWAEHAEADTRLEIAMEKLRYLTKGEEVYRYTFDILVHKDFDLKAVKEAFDNICTEWRFKFLERPEYFYLNNQNFGIVYRFAYIVKKPNLILTDGAAFQEAIAESILLK